jgi:hypothetical protein
MWIHQLVGQRSPRRRHAVYTTAGLLIVVAVLSLTGCGGSKASVTGTVTLDGKPIQGSRQLYGTVNFYRADGSGAPATGMIRESGHYEVATGGTKGLEPGNYQVAITIKEILPPAEAGGLTGNKRIGPAKYGRPAESGLTAEVTPGRNTIDFALQSDHPTNNQR